MQQESLGVGRACAGGLRTYALVNTRPRYIRTACPTLRTFTVRPLYGVSSEYSALCTCT